MLDNCEHIVEAVGRLAEGLLRECPGVRILATSREALGIAGEQVWPLPSLELPARTSSLDVVAASESVRLFTERAQGVQPGFVLDETNMDAVAEICRRLDGIPLAVELAAARVTIMTPADIAARLDQRFQLLTGGRRSAAERHQTLRGAIEWSYELLDDRERALFVRLGVFPGTFDADAVAAVATGDGLEAWDVLDAGAGLVAKSMIVADEASGTTRYQMLETLRTFAREHLDAEGDLHEMFRRHAEHYTRFAEAADAGLAGPDEVAWRKRVHLEFDNLRAAFIRCLRMGEDDDVRRALRIVAALAFEAVNDRGLGIGGWAEHLVPRVDLAPPAVRTAVLAAAAFSAQGRNDVVAMRELAAAALRDGVPPDCPGAVWAYIAIAANEGMSGDWAAAVRVIDDADRRPARRRRRAARALLPVLRRGQLPQPLGRSRRRTRRRRSRAAGGAAVRQPDRDRERAVRPGGRVDPRRSRCRGERARREHRARPPRHERRSPRLRVEPARGLARRKPATRPAPGATRARR